MVQRVASQSDSVSVQPLVYSPERSIADACLRAFDCGSVGRSPNTATTVSGMGWHSNFRPVFAPTSVDRLLRRVFITGFHTSEWLPTTVIQYRDSRVPAAVPGAGAFSHGARGGRRCRTPTESDASDPPNPSSPPFRLRVEVLCDDGCNRERTAVESGLIRPLLTEISHKTLRKR